MPYRKEQFINGEIYHVVIRGIDNNLLFKDIDDYYRGIFSIYEFNNSNPVIITKRRQNIRAIKRQEGRGRASTFSVPDNRDKLVEILAFCFMPNHIHLLLRQIKNNGIAKFMQKIGTGYGGYFNRKYGRKGYVFQNRFVSVLVKNNEQLKTLFVYIHANSISLIEPKWKEIGIKNPTEVIKFLEDYKWSSYIDHIGGKNFPSVIEKDFLLKVMGGEEACKEFVENWVKYKGEMKEFSELSLE